MLIAYCEKCGLRVPDAPAEPPPGGVYCKTCAPTLPVASRNAGSGRQRATPGKGSGIVTPVKRSETAAVPNRAAAPSQASNTGMIMGLGGLGIGVLIGAFFAFSGSKPEANTGGKTEKNNPKPPLVVTDKAPQKPDAPPKTESQIVKAEQKTEPKPEATPAKTDTSKPVKHDDEDRAKPNKPQVIEVVDVREEFASRKWKDLLAAEKSTKMAPHELRQQVEAFAKSYANTKPGKEAAEWLQKTPVALPPPPLPSSTLLATTFDFDSDLKWIKTGTKETALVYGDKGGFAVRSKPIEDPKSFFGASIVYNFADKPITITKDTWVRFAYKAEDAGDFCFHSNIGDGDRLFEAWGRGMQCGKWKWATLKISDYKRAIRGEGLPEAGMRMHSIAMLITRKGEKCSVVIDNLTVGDGPVPEDPKE